MNSFKSLQAGKHSVNIRLFIYLFIYLFYICTVHSRYEDFFIKIQLMHSL